MTRRWEVAEVLRLTKYTFIKRYRPPFYLKKVISDITTCRTAVLGGHVAECSKCGKREISYNSCRNRCCPKCEGSKQALWVEERRAELLPVPYFHVVFTIPHLLNRLVLEHRKECLDILFKAASETLIEVAQRKFGGELGFFSILHTWGRTLALHPHLHIVVPGGTWDGEQFRKSSEKFLLPVKILSDVFRAKYVKKLKTTSVLDELGDTEKKQLLKQLFSKPWVVYAKPPFGGPDAVLKYLARYTHRIAISNSRIESISENGVTFRYRDPKEQNKEKLCSLTAIEFTRRFLQHVPPPGFVRIRYYGFLSHAKRGEFLPKIKQSFPSIRDQSKTKLINSGSLDPDSDKQQRSACCKAPIIIRELLEKKSAIDPITVEAGKLQPWNSS